MKKIIIFLLLALTALTVFVSCEYEGPTVTSISVKTKPANPQYLNCNLDTTGMVVVGKLSNGKEIELTNYTVSPSVLTRLGTQMITVSYEKKNYATQKATFTVNVVEKSADPDNKVESISIKNAPNKVLYKEGETLDLTGLELEALWTNGNKTTVISGYTSSITSGTALTTSNNSITFTYQTKSVSTKLYVYEAGADLVFMGIKVVSTPTNVQFEGTALDKTGLVVVALYQFDQETIEEYIPQSEYTTSPTTLGSAGNQTIKVEYTKDSVTTSTTFTVDVQSKSVKSIQVIKYPTEKQYTYLPFDKTGMELEVTYNDDSKTILSGTDLEDVTVTTPTDFGEYIQLEVSYNNKTCFVFTNVENTFKLKVAYDSSNYWYEDIPNFNQYGITSVVFTTNTELFSDATPTDLTECQKGMVNGYLSGTDFYIVTKGDKIYANENCSYMFYDFSSLTKIEDLILLDTTFVSNMSSMFSYCRVITSLDLSHFDTSNVYSMHNMFCACGNITSLDLSHFVTSNVTDMGGMFSSCSILTDLHIENFTFGANPTMSNMFNSCKSLENVFINTSNTDLKNNIDEYTIVAWEWFTSGSDTGYRALPSLFIETSYSGSHAKLLATDFYEDQDKTTHTDVTFGTTTWASLENKWVDINGTAQQINFSDGHVLLNSSNLRYYENYNKVYVEPSKCIESRTKYYTYY